MLDCKNTYWASEGKYQTEYDAMQKAVTDGVFEFTKTTLNVFHRYYRFYNDGDLPNVYRWRQEEYAEILEEKVSDRIEKEWKKFMNGNTYMLRSWKEKHVSELIKK